MTRAHHRAATFAAAEPIDDCAWMARAACRKLSLWALDRMFFSSEIGRRGEKRIREATAVCRGCAVRAQCLDYADRLGIEDSVYGGLDGKQRDARRTKRAGA